QRTRLRRLPTAPGRGPVAALLRRLPLSPPLVGLRLDRCRLAGPALAAATAAAALGSGRRLFARLDGGLECYGVRCLRWRSGSLDGRLLLGATADTKPAQRSPSCARAAAAPSGAARSVRDRL